MRGLPFIVQGSSIGTSSSRLFAMYVNKKAGPEARLFLTVSMNTVTNQALAALRSRVSLITSSATFLGQGA